jgi:hypothetical protein
MLQVTHNHGFFSNYTVTLYRLIGYFNEKKTLPKTLDTSKTYNLYKYENNIDVTFNFFLHYDNSDIMFDNENITNSKTAMGFQFYNYKNINYIEIIPFIRKYFSPSNKIINIQNELLFKYNINVDNCIGLYYRGTDKCKETRLDSFDSFYNKALEVISKNESTNKNLQFLVQTDSANFLNYMKSKSNNIICIEENCVSFNRKGLHYERTAAENFKDIQYLLATMLILSKCKYLLTCSNNVAIVTMFYRYLYKNGVTNIYQNLDLKWL